MRHYHLLITALLVTITLGQSAAAMEAGEYYYIIAERCELRGPEDPEERDKVTPDLRLFDVVPAGISDYYVKMNTEALRDYAPEGQEYLTDLAARQAYTAGTDANTDHTHHDFMLQREAIDLAELIRTLNVFSQRQTAQGYFYRQLLTLPHGSHTFKAVTRVRLTELGQPQRLYLADFSSQYFKLDQAGQPETKPFIEVDHRAALTRAIHEQGSPYAQFTQDGVCGEKWPRA